MDLETVGTIGAAGARSVLQGADVITVNAGKSVKIETIPNGEEVLAALVPAGKVWRVTIEITVIETDA